MSNPEKKISSKLSKHFDSLKIKNTDNLFLHTNIAGITQYLRSKNKSCNLFFKLLKKKIGANGSIIIPTYNYNFAKTGTFDFKNCKSDVGYFTNYLLKKNLSKRTLDPIFSHLLFGKKFINKKSFFNKINTNAFGNDSIFKFLENNKFKIICFCCSPDRITYLHYIEQQLKIPYRYKKIFKGNFFHKNKKKEISYHYYVGKKKVNYSIKEKKILKLLDPNKFIKSEFGKFESFAIDVNYLTKSLHKIIKKSKFFLIK